MELLGKELWANNTSPKIYVSTYYEYRRNGANMEYRVKAEVSTVTGSSKFGYPIKLIAKADNSEVFRTTLKSASPSQWSSVITYTSDWFSIANKTSGKTSLEVNYYSGSGSSRDSYYTYDMYVAPAYPSIISFSVSKVDETVLKFSFSADSVIDYIWYSTNNGSSWTGYDIADGTSGSFNVSGLSANTSYNCKIRIRRRDSQLTVDSSAYSQTTYNYPYVNSVKDFVIGNSVTIGLYNPLGRNVTVYMKQNNTSGTQFSSVQTSGTSISITPNADLLYQSIPSSSYGVGCYYCSYSGRTVNSSTAKYNVDTTVCQPIFDSSGIDYYDSKSSVVTITGNNKLIVRNNSNLKVSVSGAIANKYASGISGYDITFNGVTKSITSDGTVDFGVVNVSSDMNLTVVVKDSRNITKTISKNVVVADWVNPTATISSGRVNNYEDDTQIDIKSTISSVDSKNEITSIVCRYKKTNETTYSSDVELSDNTINIISLNKLYEYDVQLVISDKFGSTTYNWVVAKGIPIFFIDTIMKSIGINCFPTSNESLAINGTDYLEYEVVDEW